MKLNRLRVIVTLAARANAMRAEADLMMRGQRDHQIAEAKEHVKEAQERLEDLLQSDANLYTPGDVRRLREKVEAIDKYLLLVGMSSDEEVEAGSLGKLRDLL